MPAEVFPDDWHRWSADQPVLIRPLTRGLTNRSYLLATKDTRVVLRWNSQISAELDLDRRAEEQVLYRADKAMLGAPLIHCDPDYRYLVTGFIEGQPWDTRRSGTETALTQLARLTRNIHQLPVISARLDIHRKVSSYWQSIPADVKHFRRLTLLDQKARPHIHAAETMNSNDVLCHNDLQAANLISGKDGKLYAIDWEYAATGDPFYDLAVITEEHQLRDEELQQFLAEYLQRPPSGMDLKRLAHWRIIYVYLSILWYAIQHAKGNLPDIDLDATITAQGQYLSTLLAGF
ncbi:phosphotransferase [Microbulbifer hydrolyticus]|uniref:Phosphotransferase n=1 Tax=Microbulbifer hydrolyticus TaxID=48074 RepID=A0A6P1TE19_9GAMM|nr:phosphotransferase [Microbulbifer hydrolyticus]MBB5212225.1 thiamine kinase [Microbulbifer hydrolyticus]QHQ39883.1 phosphotransferase [Microbulbifer hydrolyticus]